MKPRIPDLSVPNRDKKMTDILSALHKKHGVESVMRMSDEASKRPHDVIPTGSIAFDRALGVGGWPLGRIIECYGSEGGGKTTMALQAVASIQKLGGIAAYVDVEHALDLLYAAKIGVDVPNLLFSQPDSGEQALQIVEELAKSKSVRIIVIDSVAALVPQAELDGEIGDKSMALQAQLMSQALRKLKTVAHKSNCLLFFINQLRSKVGVVFGNPETQPGGQALKFYSSVRLDVRKGAPIKRDDVAIGHKVKLKVVKNKVAPPGVIVEPDLIYGIGLHKTGEILDLAVQYEIIKKSGSWLAYNGDRLALGRDNTVEHLDKNPGILAEIESHVRERIFKD